MTYTSHAVQTHPCALHCDRVQQKSKSGGRRKINEGTTAEVSAWSVQTKKPMLEQGLFYVLVMWWRGKDSNLRRQCRQIYSLIPLTAREPLHGVLQNLQIEKASKGLALEKQWWTE